MNLRNHRKIMVVDGKIGFTGGMNIRVGHYADRPSKHAIQDLHFKVEGPVVRQMQEVFINDWYFATKERLTGDAWYPSLKSCGEMVARGIPDGPDEDFEEIRWTILGAIALARSSIRIMTPYFLPDSTLISNLSVAAMAGVDVEIILPEKNNLLLVQWASTSFLSQLLERGVRIYLSPQPFDHSKILIIDDCWSLIGSSNWDARSLRLNFEFNIECYDHLFALQLAALFRSRLERSRQQTLEALQARSLAARLRDGTARLVSPYL